MQPTDWQCWFTTIINQTTNPKKFSWPFATKIIDHPQTLRTVAREHAFIIFYFLVFTPRSLAPASCSHFPRLGQGLRYRRHERCMLPLCCCYLSYFFIKINMYAFHLLIIFLCLRLRVCYRPRSTAPSLWKSLELSTPTAPSQKWSPPTLATTLVSHLSQSYSFHGVHYRIDICLNDTSWMKDSLAGEG